MSDQIPRIIGKFLIQDTIDELRLSTFYLTTGGVVLEMLKEPEHISIRRNELRVKLQTLKKSKNIIKNNIEEIIL